MSRLLVCKNIKLFILSIHLKNKDCGIISCKPQSKKNEVTDKNAVDQFDVKNDH